MDQVKEKAKFNWMGLLFGGVYYAGYGKLSKGIAMGVLSVFPLTAIMVSLYAGFKANKELDADEQSFNWGKAVLVYCVMGIIIGSYVALLPSGNLLDDVSGYWRNGAQEEFMIDFASNNPVLAINGEVQSVKIIDVDTNDERLSFKLQNGVVATLIQEWNNSGESFTLTLMTPQTKPIPLAFVRRL